MLVCTKGLNHRHSQTHHNDGRRLFISLEVPVKGFHFSPPRDQLGQESSCRPWKLSTVCPVEFPPQILRFTVWLFELLLLKGRFPRMELHVPINRRQMTSPWNLWHHLNASHLCCSPPRPLEVAKHLICAVYLRGH